MGNNVNQIKKNTLTSFPFPSEQSQSVPSIQTNSSRKRFILLMMIITLFVLFLGILIYSVSKSIRSRQVQSTLKTKSAPITLPNGTSNKVVINQANGLFTHPQSLYTLRLPAGWTIQQKNSDSYKSRSKTTVDYIIKSPDYLPSTNSDLIPTQGAYIWIVAEKACSNDNQWNFEKNIPRAQDKSNTNIGTFTIDGQQAIQYSYYFNQKKTATDTVVTVGGYLYTFLYRYANKTPLFENIYSSVLSSVIFTNKSVDPSIHPQNWSNATQMVSFIRNQIPPEWTLFKNIKYRYSLKYPSTFKYWLYEDNIFFFSNQNILDNFLIKYNKCQSETLNQGGTGFKISCTEDIGKYYTFKAKIIRMPWHYNQFSNKTKRDLDREIQSSTNYAYLCSEDYIPYNFHSKEARIYFKSSNNHTSDLYDLYINGDEMDYYYIELIANQEFSDLDQVLSSITFD